MLNKESENTPSSLPPVPENGSRALHWVRLAPRMPFVWTMRLYRRFVSPLYGDKCRYYPSCSKYALDAFEVKGAVLGFFMTAWRLLRCNPLSPGGLDYVQGSFMEKQSRSMKGGTIDTAD